MSVTTVQTARPVPQVTTRAVTAPRQTKRWIDWVTTTDHKKIGIMYLVTTFVFFMLGGIEALLMRLQLAEPGNTLLSGERFNELLTLHGTTMVFLFLVPVWAGFANYFVPLMIGARDMAFPRLNALSYWLLLAGGIVFYASLFWNPPEAGWVSFLPLANQNFSPGGGEDAWIYLIHLTGISSLLGAINFYATIANMRARGMSWGRLPLFVWTILTYSVLLIFALPVIAAGVTMLLTERHFGTHFFDPAQGGSVLLWEHLFWFFGHPEVYIIFIPATGIVSSILPVFCRRKVFGYTALVLSLVSTGFIGFGLWLHHMFATNLPKVGQSFFTAASMMIAIPTGVQIFCWIATLWGGRLRFKTPLLFVLGFFLNFIIGGLSGVMVASVSLDQQVHDTFFVVAHLHYVLIGGAVFPLFAGFYYWFPKFTGRMLSEGLGRWVFALFMIGFNLTFFPMHQLGLKGMPRRVYTYLPEMGWGGLNLLSSIGGLIIAVSVLLFVIDVFRSLRAGELAGDNPWEADTLEWATSSPPPAYNFARLPTVAGRAALWDRREDQPIIKGVRSDLREMLVTNVLDAEPDHKTVLPSPTIWPFLSAVAVTGLFIGSIFTPWAVPVGAIPVAIALVGWFWPNRQEHEEELSAERDGRPPQEVEA
ncbi:MAG TPA: cytochrome c oxidase subunit I [Blastocatellia bacterium]|nr:cytochrome c oxidase subunit I [Blastocatellia bacterium]